LSREQSAQARTATTEAAINSLKNELTLAQSHAADAQRELDDFNQTHRLPVGPRDEYQQTQLRIAVEDANKRIADLQARIDRATVMTSVVQTTDTLDFQIIDQPVEDAKPSGGTRPGALIAGSAMAGGIALASLLVVAGTLLAGRTRREAHIHPVAAATPVASSPDLEEQQAARHRVAMT
jgi:hypothetical protein